MVSNKHARVSKGQEVRRMSLVDLLISIGSAGLAIFSVPTVLNKNSQVPRKTASIPSASILTYFVPLFAMSGLDLTARTIAGQAIVWSLIVARRPGRKIGELDACGNDANRDYG